MTENHLVDLCRCQKWAQQRTIREFNVCRDAEGLEHRAMSISSMWSSSTLAELGHFLGQVHFRFWYWWYWNILEYIGSCVGWCWAKGSQKDSCFSLPFTLRECTVPRKSKKILFQVRLLLKDAETMPLLLLLLLLLLMPPSANVSEETLLSDSASLFNTYLPYPSVDVHVINFKHYEPMFSFI